MTGEIVLIPIKRFVNGRSYFLQDGTPFVYEQLGLLELSLIQRDLYEFCVKIEKPFTVQNTQFKYRIFRINETFIPNCKVGDIVNCSVKTNFIVIDNEYKIEVFNSFKEVQTMYFEIISEHKRGNKKRLIKQIILDDSASIIPN